MCLERAIEEGDNDISYSSKNCSLFQKLSLTSFPGKTDNSESYGASFRWDESIRRY